MRMLLRGSSPNHNTNDSLNSVTGQHMETVRNFPLHLYSLTCAHVPSAGMRCIFCNNYVNFPSDMNHVARVECPYCVQCFCVGCKRPWHYGGRCPLEIVDDSLEDWKKRSGAQKCPSCKKLIEKDDPDTCNHMVHKITDPIPCIRDRTDFCCKLSFRLYIFCVDFCVQICAVKK